MNFHDEFIKSLNIWYLLWTIKSEEKKKTFYQNLPSIVPTQGEVNSVATLLLQKSTRFLDKKH